MSVITTDRLWRWRGVTFSHIRIGAEILSIFYTFVGGGGCENFTEHFNPSSDHCTTGCHHGGCVVKVVGTMGWYQQLFTTPY